MPNRRTQELLDRVRSIFGAENVIGVSTDRSGNGRSAHNHGNAIDFSVRGMTSHDIARRLLQEGVGPFDQLIYYNGSTHVHIGAERPGGGIRGQILEATKRNGVTTYAQSTAKKLLGDVVGGAVDRAEDAGRKAIDKGKNAVSRALGVGVGSAIGGPAGAAIGGGGLLDSINPLKWLMDYLNEIDFATRTAMIIVGLVLLIAALGWLGKDLIPMGKVANAAKSVAG